MIGPLILAGLASQDPVPPLVEAPAPPPIPAPAPATTSPSLSQFGWQLAYSDSDGLPTLAEMYIEPRSIRALDPTQTKLSVTASWQWNDLEDNSWRINTIGLIIDCSEKSFQRDWTSTKVSGQFVISYVDAKNTYSPPAGSPMEAVIERVCTQQ
jgi:hypothetical protein